MAPARTACIASLVAACSLAPCLGAGAAEARVVVSPLVGEHMVLPSHGDQLLLEGRAPRGEIVHATLGGERARAKTNDQGRWRLTWSRATVLGGREARARRAMSGGDQPDAGRGSAPDASFTLKILGPEGFVFHDVLLGEVWLAAGQSNMAMPTRRVGTAGEQLAREAAESPLRFFRLDNEAEDDLRGVRGHWERASLAEAARFSAVATSFGVTRAREKGLAVGLVQAAWDATPIESWVREEAWSAYGHGDLRPPSVPLPSAEAERDLEARRAAWAQAARFHDAGDEGFGQGFAEPGFDDGAWRTMTVPGSFESQGLDLDGVVWLRRRITLPVACVGRALTLALGPIDDCDRTFVNGVLVGSTCHEIDAPYRFSRTYRVPASVVTSPSLLLATRVVDEIGDGGFSGLAAEMKLVCDEHPPIALAGSWRWKVEREAPRDRPGFRELPALPAGWPTPATPGIFARRWIAPLAPFALHGVLWYQGENNLGQAARYAPSLAVWLADWSAIFERPDLPVLLVQLPGHDTAAATRDERNWAQLREAQRRLALTAPRSNVRLVVTTDLGGGRDVHLVRKQAIGERAAWLASHPLERATGPWLQKTERIAGGALLTFQSQGFLRLRQGTPAPPTVPGLRCVVQARGQLTEEACGAVVAGNTVRLSWPATQKVVLVRYAYDDEAAGALTDDSGWPASPFETQTELCE